MPGRSEQGQGIASDNKNDKDEKKPEHRHEAIPRVMRGRLQGRLPSKPKPS